LYSIENGCKWRKLPEKYGKWNTIYKRANRWAKNGTLAAVFTALQREQIIKIRIERLSLDSTSIKVHPDAHGAAKKTENRASEDGTTTELRSVWLHVGASQATLEIMTEFL
jgi:transposase